MTNPANDLTSRLKAFLEQYNSEETVRKYIRDTAGYGISYLLDHDYEKIYLECIRTYIPNSRLKTGIRLWEFGYGGGSFAPHRRRGTARNPSGICLRHELLRRSYFGGQE